MFEKLMLKFYGPDWKSSLNGDLNLFSKAAATALPFVVITPQSPLWLKITNAVLLMGAGGGQAVLGRSMKDAGSVLAVLPNSSTPQVVPSTEVPLNPEAEVITPKTK